jgi:hypothetical protein
MDFRERLTIIERGTNMKRTHLIAVLAGIVAVAVFAADASAMYHPTLGRFTSRDPGPGGAMRGGAAGPASAGAFIPRDPTGNNHYGDGMNLYQYVGSNPIVRADPSGLKWQIDRDGLHMKARAIPERGDTVAGLATEIGLSPTDAIKWITWEPTDSYLLHNGKLLKKGGTGYKTVNDPMTGCEWFEVPNTVLAYWAGDFAGLGRFWVRWQQDVATLRARGFVVDEQKGWTGARWETELIEMTKYKDLHGVFFWGHGVIGRGIIPWWDTFGLITNPKSGWVGLDLGGGEQTTYARWRPEYQLGLGILWACGTDPTAKPFFSGIFKGFSGVGVPHGSHLYGPSVAELLPPGSQGTRK